MNRNTGSMDFCITNKIKNNRDLSLQDDTFRFFKCIKNTKKTEAVMSWDRSWNFGQKTLSIEDVRGQTKKMLTEYNEISVSIEQEADDCITCFFSVPVDGTEEASVVEISIYHMGGKSYILSLEGDASDNAKQVLANSLAEDLAAAFGAEPLEE